MRQVTRSRVSGMILAAILPAATATANDHIETYKISVTNLTPGQPIAPVMAATHRAGLAFFRPGQAPSPELANLAEAGDGHPMATLLMSRAGYADAQVASSGIMPGHTVSMTVVARPGVNRLSLGAMLGNTNDAFIALRNVKLPMAGSTVAYMADAYDAGTETNDESCASVPGPACGGAALSPDDAGEGFVHIHNGIHGIGGLNAAKYDWRNPTAQVVITHVSQSK